MKGEGEDWGEAGGDEDWDQRKKDREKDGRVETSGEEMAHENVLGTTMRQKCRRELGKDKKGKTKQNKTVPRKLVNLVSPEGWLLC